MARGDRVELRGFGAFGVKQHPARIGRNPKTGDPVAVDRKSMPHFKAGKEMREPLTSKDNWSGAVVLGANDANANSYCAFSKW